MFHNEALLLVDALLCPAVQAMGLDVPPAAPLAGQCWIVGSAAEGAWSGQASTLASWSEGGWRHVAPQPGMRAWSVADGGEALFTGEDWRLNRPGAAIAEPSGGTVVDAEARSVITAVLAALRRNGGIAAG
jgi:hypothetical protein